MTQHNPPTDAELSEWEALITRVLAAHNATVGTADIGLLLAKQLACGDLADGAVAALPRLLAEVRRLRAAPLGYDAAIKVAKAVLADRSLCEAHFRAGPGTPGAAQLRAREERDRLIDAIVRATLGDDAVASAERAYLDALYACEREGPNTPEELRLRDELEANATRAGRALRRAREEAGKRYSRPPAAR